MKARSTARTWTRKASVALLPALLLATTGCGGAPDGPAAPDAKAPASPRPTATPSAGSAAPAAPASPKNAASKLERSALEPGDLDGYQISAQNKNPNAPSGQPQADRKACQPLADVMGDKPDPAARETVNRGVGSQKQVGLAVSASVSSYAEADAERLMARLRDAVAECGTGFSATVQKQTGSYRDVKPLAYKTGGDENVSWTTTATAAGVSAQVHLVVVRHGATVVRLMALNVADAAKKAQVPQEVADKQLDKIRKVG
ncbi:hypothetical protein ABZ934_13300 [Streptomyces sp. NPDC046557]|uniref:hypothetical protein n=1 Tax=Streptomyces sp. NPDC046557 TaxID=3155372 RepID=UPI0033D773A4